MGMADYPAQLARERRLADGRSVLIRPVRPDDEEALGRFFTSLSAETRHLRFMKFVRSVNEKLIRFFTHIDYDNHMAFVCEAKSGDEVELVGDARYVVEGSACEFSVVIADGWHRSGIAGLLMETLIEHARARGLRTMEGLVLRENRHMLKFVKALGFEVHAAEEDATIARAVKKLAPA
jgi:acetyltransferase